MTTEQRRSKRKIKDYNWSDMYSLWDAYNSFSQAKEKAWEYCKELCAKHGGRGLKAIGANSSFFSAGFIFDGDDGKQKFMYITKNYDVVCDYE